MKTFLLTKIILWKEFWKNAKYLPVRLQSRKYHLETFRFELWKAWALLLLFCDMVMHSSSPVIPKLFSNECTHIRKSTRPVLEESQSDLILELYVTLFQTCFTWLALLLYTYNIRQVYVSSFCLEVALSMWVSLGYSSLLPHTQRHRRELELNVRVWSTLFYV